MDYDVGHFLLSYDSKVTVSQTTGNAMVLVETRDSFWLRYVLANAVTMNPGWKLYVFGTKAVLDRVKRHVDGDLVCVELMVDPQQKFLVSDYSRLLLDSAFWNIFASERRVLIIQLDTVLVRPMPEWVLTFDYIGAVCGKTNPQEFIMNGGLSLRNPKAMIRAIQKMTPAQKDLPEDVAFCETMRHDADFILPSMQQCHAFAIESRGDPVTAIGAHGTDKDYAQPGLLRQLLGTI